MNLTTMWIQKIKFQDTKFSSQQMDYRASIFYSAEENIQLFVKVWFGGISWPL